MSVNHDKELILVVELKIDVIGLSMEGFISN
jgi:hypothetical protein